MRLFQSVSTLSTALNQIINSHVHIEKFYELENNKIIDRSKFKLNVEINKVNLNNVSFSHLNSEEVIFDNLNIQIDKNSHILLLGPNGSGKSTLLD